MATEDQVLGCLLGLVLADAAGSTFEGMDHDDLHRRFANKEDALKYGMQRDSLRYTDDGQMALALAEHLSSHDHIDPNALMSEFCEVYESWRGYGRGARTLIEAFRDSADYEFLAEHLFPGGSLGNGGAMRSAPVGLRFAPDSEKVWHEARQSAWPTHRHELGIEGAQVIAQATAIAMRGEKISPRVLAEELHSKCETIVFQNRFEKLSKLTSEEQVSEFGNGIEAHESAVTAIACFSLHPDDYEAAIATAIWQGGDTDTIAAMAGALVGARVGARELPQEPVLRIEHKGFLSELEDLAQRLSSVSQ